MGYGRQGVATALQAVKAEFDSPVLQIGGEIRCQITQCNVKNAKKLGMILSCSKILIKTDLAQNVNPRILNKLYHQYQLYSKVGVGLNETKTNRIQP